MLRPLLYIFCSLIVLVTISGQASAKQPVKVAAVQIPLMVESAKQGVFIEILNEVSKRTHLTFDVKVVPGKRAHSLFKNKQVDLLVPFPKGNREQSGLLSDPIYTKRDFIFVRKGTAIPRSLDEMKGMRLGITAHYRYKPSLYDQAGIVLDKGPDDVTNMRKLDSGRIDGFLVEEFSGLSAIEESQVRNIVFDPRNPIFSYDAVILIQQKPEGEAYLKQINTALRDMKSEGVYMKIISQIHKNM
jgi:ABC-type amino acid transport substrate-binding protein